MNKISKIGIVCIGIAISVAAIAVTRTKETEAQPKLQERRIYLSPKAVVTGPETQEIQLIEQ